MLSIILAYTAADQETANEITTDVESHVEVEHVRIGRANEGDTLAFRLKDRQEPTVVLVSHRFLTNPNCILGAYDVFARNQQVLPVLVNGRQPDELGDEPADAPLSLDNQAAVMTYVNHWQDRYLDLRAQADDLRAEGGESFERYLRKIRESSAQVEETLNLIKDGWHLRLRQLRVNDYHQLFLFADRPKLWEVFRSRNEDLPDLSSIPGLSALPGRTSEPTVPEDNAASLEDQVSTDEENEVIGDIESDQDVWAGGQVQAELQEASPEDRMLPPLEVAETDGHLVAYAETNDGTEDTAQSIDELPTLDTTPGSDFVTVDISDDDQADRWIDRAWQLFDGGEAGAGLDLLETAREALPEHVDLHYQYALYLASHSADDPQPALVVLEELLDADPLHPDALFLRAELTTAVGQVATARESLETLLEVDPVYPEANLRLGQLIVAHFNDERTEALTYLRRATEEAPTDAEAAYLYGRTLYEVSGNTKKAAKVLRGAIEADPNHAPAHFALAEVLAARDKFAAARNAYLIAIDLEPAFDTPDNRRLFLGDRAEMAVAQNGEEALLNAPGIVQLKSSEDEGEIEDREPLPAPPTSGGETMIGDDDASADAARERAALRQQLKLAKAALADKDAHHLEALAELHLQLSEQAAELAKRAEELHRLSTPPPGPGAGKIALISGATSGIGHATAKALASDGYHLILTGRREERLHEIGGAISTEYAVECFPLAFDVRDRNAVRSAIEELPEAWRRIHVLINNAGKAKGFDPIHAGEYAHWEEMIDVNLKGLLYLTREVSPLMVELGRGTIINVCSTAGKEVYPNGNVYCATKHAVDALTRGMRLDLVRHGIRVGQICPAHVEETEFALVRFDGDAERANIYEDFQPLRSRDVGQLIRHMVGQPAHVNVLDLVVQGTQQASSTLIDRSGRARFAPEEE